MATSAKEPTERTGRSSSSPNSANTNTAPRYPYKYRCVQCLEPAESLYRTYGTRESTIKLSQCVNSQCCGANNNNNVDVDPYCEREWLLVVIDIVLLREEAYCHVIFNRLTDFNVLEGSTYYRKSLQLIVGSSCLQAYLLWESHRAQHPNDPILGSVIWCMQLVLASSLGLTAFGLGIYGTLSLLLLRRSKRRRTGSKSNADNVDPYINMLPTHVYLAVVLPTAWRVVMILVHIWENTATIRLCCSLLTFIYQFMAVTVVVSAMTVSVSKQKSNDSKSNANANANANNNDSWLLYLLPIVVGMLLRAGVGLLWTTCMIGTFETETTTTTPPLPCAGLLWPLPGTTNTNVCIL
jgi:hypothetical protein